MISREEIERIIDDLETQLEEIERIRDKLNDKSIYYMSLGNMDSLKYAIDRLKELL